MKRYLSALRPETHCQHARVARRLK